MNIKKLQQRQPKKKATTHIPRAYDTSKLGGEPEWGPVLTTHDKVDIMRALNWYSYFDDAKSCAKYLFEHYTGVVNIEPLKDLSVKRIPPILGTVCRMQSLGCKFEDRSLEVFSKTLAHTMTLVGTLDINEDGEVIDPPKPFKLTSAEKAQIKLDSLLGFVEGVIDDALANDCRTKFNMYQWLTENQIKPKDCVYITEAYAPMYAELTEALGDKENEDFQDAYGHLSRAALKRLHKIYESIVVDTFSYKDTAKKVSKTTRGTNKFKSIPLDKKLSKVKFQTQDTETQAASVDPKGIIGARELWTYNSKYKKLTRFIAKEGGFDIKGTALQNWDEDKSECKRLRQPAVVVPKVVNAGKIDYGQSFLSLLQSPQEFENVSTKTQFCLESLSEENSMVNVLTK